MKIFRYANILKYALSTNLSIRCDLRGRYAREAGGFPRYIVTSSILAHEHIQDIYIPISYAPHIYFFTSISFSLVAHLLQYCYILHLTLTTSPLATIFKL